MPLTVLEAMASGRALICSNVPGCNSCIHKDLNGYFCEANSTESLTESMKKIIDNKHQISNMGAHSRIIIEKEFNLNKIYKEYLDTIGA